jgi:hypothetical protein
VRLLPFAPRLESGKGRKNKLQEGILIMSEALQKQAPATLVQFASPFSGIQAFQDCQRMAQLLASSELVPKSYTGNVANCVIALEMAGRIGASPLAVMQNLYIVHGRPAWSSQFLIACVNASGRFSPMRYTMSGDGEGRACVAWAVDRNGERLESPAVSIAMAKAEGWVSKQGSKWQTMPELMLRYRAATLFARLYAPELTMGIHTDDEVIDTVPIVTEPEQAPRRGRKAAQAVTVDVAAYVAPAAAEAPQETQFDAAASAALDEADNYPR